MTGSETEPKGFGASVLDLFRKRLGTFILTFAFAIVGVFSNKIVDSLKFSLNRADLRAEKYDRLASDLSNHLFLSELIQLYLSKNWTTKGGLAPIIIDYNDSVTRIRSSEYVYLAMLHRYWNKPTADQLAAVMEIIGAIDKQIHRLNDELEKVNILESKPKVDPKLAGDVAEQLSSLIAKLRTATNDLLLSSL